MHCSVCRDVLGMHGTAWKHFQHPRHSKVNNWKPKNWNYAQTHKHLSIKRQSCYFGCITFIINFFEQIFLSLFTMTVPSFTQTILYPRSLALVSEFHSKFLYYSVSHSLCKYLFGSLCFISLKFIQDSSDFGKNRMIMILKSLLHFENPDFCIWKSRNINLVAYILSISFYIYI